MEKIWRRVVENPRIIYGKNMRRYEEFIGKLRKKSSLFNSPLTFVCRKIMYFLYIIVVQLFTEKFNLMMTYFVKKDKFNLMMTYFVKNKLYIKINKRDLICTSMYHDESLSWCTLFYHLSFYFDLNIQFI